MFQLRGPVARERARASSYEQYLLPGIFAQTVLFGSATLFEAALATELLFGFSDAFCWIQALIGLSVKSAEATNSAGFIWMFPLTFVSSAFVDTANMPGWLRPVADANPFTIVTNATRALYNGRSPGSDFWIAAAWAVGITAVFAFLAVRRFKRAARH